MRFPASIPHWFILRGFVLLILTVAAAGLGEQAQPAAASTNWQAIVGGQTKDAAVVALGFFPYELTVDAGDSVTWTFNSDEIHTVTFSSDSVSPAMADSGVRTEASPPFTVAFPSAGDFSFHCRIHATMSGTIHVQPSGTPYPHDQHFYTKQGKEELDDVLDDGQKDLQEQRDDARDGPRNAVTLGKDDISTNIPGVEESAYFIPRFLLDVRDVNVGDTVTWTTPDAFTPHTVTFGGLPPPPTPNFPPPNRNPVNLTGPGEQTSLNTPYPQLGVGTLVSSGFLGNFAGTQGATFNVTFNAPGTYRYYCELHRDLGMTGVIVVHARGEHEDNDQRRDKSGAARGGF